MKIVKWLIILSIFIFLFVEVISDFTWKVGDDQVYYYMGKLVSEGKMPYKDFFYAHPPLQLIAYGLAFKFIPYDFHTFKLFFILLTIVNCYLLYLLVKDDLGETIAQYSFIIALNAPTILFNASFEYGLSISLLFFLLGLKTERNGFKQNLFFFLAIMYRFHALFLIIGYYLYLLILIDWKIYVKRVIWLFNALLFANGIISLYIPNYFRDVFLYHIYKPQIALQSYDTFFTILKMNYLIFLMPLIILLLWHKLYTKEMVKYLIIPMPLAAYLMLKLSFGYYYILVILFLSVATAYAVCSFKRIIVYTPVLLFLMLSLVQYYTFDNDYRTYTFDKEVILSGDPPVISYLALTTHSKVLNDDVDINAMRYYKLENVTYLITQMMIKHPIVIIKKEEGLYSFNQEYRNYVNTCFLLNETKELKILQC